MKTYKPQNNLRKEAKKVITLLRKHKGVYFQIKDPDTFGHLGDKKGKTKAIEKIDKEFFSEIIKLDLTKHIIIVTADHSTPCSRKAHGKEPTPLLITGIKKDKSKRFTEKECKKGFLNLVQGQDLLKKV